ncbi:MAG TPA: hypothetical protein VJT12_01895 [Methyloceanibacter sp.]|jgi:hypothetical protein|nr:hypothetical protein [Methyloceanibacter sp.]
MTILDLGFSGTALGAASAASGFAADPLAGADGVAAFCPPCGAVPCVGDVVDAAGGVLWPEVAGAALGLGVAVPGVAAVGGAVCPEVAGAAFGLVVAAPGFAGAACPSGAVTGAVAPGVVAAGALGLVSAFAGKAKAIARNGTASRVRNCGKEAVKRIFRPWLRRTQSPGDL